MPCRPPRSNPGHVSADDLQAVLSAQHRTQLPYFESGSNMSPEILRTERPRLRTYTAADEAALIEVFADAHTRSFYLEMADPARVRAWIGWNLRNYEEFGLGLWAMECSQGVRLIGDCD